MAQLPNLSDIKVQGLQNIDSDIGTAITGGIAKITQSKFVPGLIADQTLLFNALTNWVSHTDGTDIVTLFNREALGKFGDRVEPVDAWKDTNVGEKLKAIKILAYIDTQLEKRFYLDRTDLQHNAEQSAFYVAEALRNLYQDIFDAINCEIIDMVTGGLDTTHTGRPIKSKLHAYTSTILGAGSTQNDYFSEYLELKRKLNEIAKLFGRTHRFTNVRDYVCLVDRETYQHLSVALERYNGESIRNIVTGEVIGHVVNGVTIFESNYLENKFDSTKNQLLGNKNYNFEGVKAIFVHKQALFAKIWELLGLILDTRAGHVYYTAYSNWGVKDGLLRPELCGYFTSATNPR